ncbi:predicted protein [Streptomyces viridosporus ATCC 14672]|uniref:Predicted protein n=1 Tax=Streptomyces viridosporus (strain ATCC 14672 / DSM 40746 / JCM 4963 / KCTC 9882 / NRRL B-12104 / FH 1290) TaxID=566461 RepID=D6A8Y6_STRV1|nr:predicted protein [Streptomyces viridosporus ATCC 14672]
MVTAIWLRASLRTAFVDGVRKQLVINRLANLEEK